MDEPLPETGPLRVLIADDSDSDRLILQTMVRRQGHEVGDSLTPFDAVMRGVPGFTGAQVVQDDLTVVTLEMVDERELADLPNRIPQSALQGPAHWSCVYEINNQTLSYFNPLPLLLHICMEVPGLRRRSGEVYTLLSELYTNALEHGILELPSSWKSSPEGFGHYYAERERRLADSEGHYIRFTLDHKTSRRGGELRILCKDSGAGFDFAGLVSALESGEPQARYAGRGLVLLQQLSRSLTFKEQGNHVEVVYHWDFTEASIQD